MDTQIISPKYKLSSVEGEVKMLTAWGKTLPCSLVADTSVSLVSLLTLLPSDNLVRRQRLLMHQHYVIMFKLHVYDLISYQGCQDSDRSSGLRFNICKCDI